MRSAYALLSASLALATQTVLNPVSEFLPSPYSHIRVQDVEQLLLTHDDPVQVMKLLDPASTVAYDEPRLLQVFGEEAQWMTEGDKLRLRKAGKGFMDLTHFPQLNVASIQEDCE